MEPLGVPRLHDRRVPLPPGDRGHRGDAYATSARGTRALPRVRAMARRSHGRGPDARAADALRASGEHLEQGPRRRDRRSGSPRATPARTESAERSSAQALSPTNTSSSSRIRYVNPQISRPSYVYEGTLSSPRIVWTTDLPCVAGRSASAHQNVDVISGPGFASIGPDARAT